MIACSLVARRTAFAGPCLVALAAGGCAGEGSVSLRFDVPDAPELRPAGAETLTLIARVAGEAPRATTAEIGDGAAIDLGDLPVEEEIWLAAEMRTAQDQLVGYGRAQGPISVQAESVTEATIPVRRPFVYLAGAGARLISLDASVASTATYQGQVSVTGTPAVLADVAGADVATITAAGALGYVATSTHAASELPGASLAASPLDAIATPDGSFLVVGHGGATPQVSVVEVATGAVRVASVPGPADRVAVTLGSDGGWWGVALIGRAQADTGCTPSRLVAFQLDDPETAAVVDTGLGLSDLAGDVRTGTVLVADRCGDRILVFEPIAGELDTSAPLMEIPAPTAVAAGDGRAWAVGHDLATTNNTGKVPDGIIDAWLVLGSVDTAAGGAEVDALPPVVEAIVATDLEFPDQSVTQQLHANDVVAEDLVILPGGQHLGLLTRTVLHGDQVSDIFGTIIIPRVDVTTREYWLLDAATRVFTQRVRPECGITVGPCDIDFTCDWECLPDIDNAIAGTFSPTGIAALFGAR